MSNDTKNIENQTPAAGTPVASSGPVPASRGGVVDGDQNANPDDLIDLNYDDDPEGDRVDNNDAILSNPGSNDDIIKAREGNDTILAGEGDDDAYGGNGDDYIEGGAGDDTLRGEAGDDTLKGDDGRNFLEGGDGDDKFIGGEGADSLFGGEGMDTIDYSGSSDPVNVNLDDNTLSGGDAGNDSIDSGSRIEGVIGSAGDDTLTGGTGPNDLRGGDGDDSITAGAGDTVAGDGGDDYFTVADDQLAPGETLYVIGGETGEVNGDTLDLRGLVDDPAAQVTYSNTDPGAGGGLTGVATLNDGTIVDFTEIENMVFDGPSGGPDGIVSGTPGDDNIDLGYTGDPDGDRIDNNDAILGPNPGSNDDIVRAGDGDDTVDGGEGDDDIDGGTGDDDLSGGVGDDTITDGSGSETVSGGDGDDLIDVSGNDPALDTPPFVVPGVIEPDAFPDDDRDSVDGGAGNDTIRTGDDRDTINGGDGDDSIESGIDDDLVDGGAGNDYIDDIQGADTIYGGDGNDTIIAGIDTLSDYVGDDPNNRPGESDPNQEDGRDFVDGGAGDDLIFTGDDRDTIVGGLGNDTINGGIDDDEISGGEGDDSLTGSHGSDTITGGAGNDTIHGGFGNDPIPGFAGEEPDATDPVPENGRDYLDGGAGDDVIYGEDDDDTLIGGTGDDYLDGGIDNDSLEGGAGNDTLIGGQGDDMLAGGADDDLLEGGDGDDTLDGGRGNDILDGGDGANQLSGGQGDDLITGGAGDDTVVGGFGNDTIDTGAGDDTIEAGAGDDVVTAGAGDDTVRGGDGEDTISGGPGNDSLEGNDDADTFIDVNGGDTVSGGAGFGPDSRDFDTLDLTGSIDGTPGAVRYELQDTVTDSDGNGIDGSVVYFDADDNEVGQIDFTNIEEIIDTVPPCFTPGTLIATPKGERLVEDLREGDRVITRDNGIQQIRWVGHTTLDGRALAENPRLQPVLIRAGALGNGLPERDMLVSPNHRVLVANDKTALYFEEREVLVAAKHLVDGKGIVEVEASSTTYIHFMFDQHEVVLSDGAWTESFQPGDQSLKGIDSAQRDEILALFPELENAEGLADYAAARRTLKKHEAALLLK
ncbi:Hint domain-containing protein [Oceaniglobus trochenteri]|uniref:Hint domain-containing protein n=1 Tax=Oceaniglobus trochenteri TaxID=2763260 RepID=UPI00247AC9B0|nr:Hint domain-containing protein [Oceaniglobus trochenteri]